MSKPRAPERFERLLTPLLSLNNRDILPRIRCPTLVIGGEEDRVIEAKVQRAMAQLNPNSRLKMYPGYGHGNSFVNPDYPRQISSFLQEVMAASRASFMHLLQLIRRGLAKKGKREDNLFQKTLCKRKRRPPYAL